MLGRFSTGKKTPDMNISGSPTALPSPLAAATVFENAPITKPRVEEDYVAQNDQQGDVQQIPLD